MKKYMSNVIFIPVCIWFPVSNSAIVTDVPFLRLTFDEDGKHPCSIACITACKRRHYNLASIDVIICLIILFYFEMNCIFMVKFLL